MFAHERLCVTPDVGRGGTWERYAGRLQGLGGGWAVQAEEHPLLLNLCSPLNTWPASTTGFHTAHGLVGRKDSSSSSEQGAGNRKSLPWLNEALGVRSAPYSEWLEVEEKGIFQN